MSNGNKVDSNGNHYCSWCGAWIGNHNTGETPDGEKSYFAIIKAKYCAECRPKAINQQTAVRLHNLNNATRANANRKAGTLSRTFVLSVTFFRNICFRCNIFQKHLFLV